MKNMTIAILYDPDATNSRPIKNMFGNLDTEIKKTRHQGFKKVSDDLLIEYARDEIAENYEEQNYGEQKQSGNEQRF